MQKKELGGDVNPAQLNVIEMSMLTETSPASLDTGYRTMMVVRHTPVGTEQERTAVANVFKQIAALRHPADQIIGIDFNPKY